MNISGPDALKCLTFLTHLQATMIEGILQMKEFTENPSVAELNFNNLNYIPSGKNKLNLTECFIGLLFQVPFYLGLIIYTMNTMSGNGTNTNQLAIVFAKITIIVMEPRKDQKNQEAIQANYSFGN